VRIALDTNVLVYAERVNGDDRAFRVRRYLEECADDEKILPVQTLAELFTVLTRKAKWPASRARASVLAWRAACEVVDTTDAALLEAMEIAEAHQFSLWDSLVLATAAQARCRVVVSEDMHAGFTWRGVEIRTPFG
jgi:predicted nucleic acid-binding protein